MRRACLRQCLLLLEQPHPAFLLPPGVETVLVLGVGVVVFGLLRLGIRFVSEAEVGLDSERQRIRDALRSRPPRPPHPLERRRARGAVAPSGADNNSC
jgi:hypothetical protein